MPHEPKIEEDRELPEDTHIRSLRTAVRTDRRYSGTRPRLPSPDEGGWRAYCEQRTARLGRIAAVIAAVPPVVTRPWDWQLDGGVE